MPRQSRRRSAPPPDSPPITVRIEAIVFGGQGLAHLEDGRVALVSYAAPGELVEATVERIHPDYVEAVATRVIEASPDRVEAPCPLFGRCGGCQLQHLAYPAQLAAKKHMVVEQLRRIGGLEDITVDDTVGAENPWGYRNHVRLSTGPTHGDVGFISRRGRGLLTVNECPIAEPFVNDLLPSLQGKARGLHQVQIRLNATTESFLIAPEIAGLELPTGQDGYLERLAGHYFYVSESAFFQVNNAQAERLVALVGAALPESGRLLVDAFAGVGTFAVIFANRFRRVIAIEEAASATKDAKQNIKPTPNVGIRIGKVEHVLPALDIQPDAVLLDPPRPGCAPPVLEAILRMRPPVVVYVSCNPATLARDLRVLVDGGYQVDRVTPIDMFPQTGHIESVTRLSLADSGLMPKVVLASGSPRRRELLAALIPTFDVVVSNVDEGPVGDDPIAGAIRLATEKALAVAALHPGSIVIGSDTVVHDGLRDYGKPASPPDAEAMLRALRGRPHRVVTGVAVAHNGALATAVSVSTVTLAAMTDATIADYVASGRPLDKAGAYAIQDADVPTVDTIDGCYCGVMGLPLWTLRALLLDTGITATDPSLTYPRCAACPERRLD